MDDHIFEEGDKCDRGYEEDIGDGKVDPNIEDSKYGEHRMYFII